MQKSFLMRTQYMLSFDMMEDAELAALMRAIMHYHGEGAEAAAARLEGHGSAALMFAAMKDDFAANIAKYEKACRQNAENGRRGGRAKAANARARSEAEAAAGGSAPEASGEPAQASWKTEAWTRIQAASWTQENMEASRGAWFTVADSVGPDGVDAVVLAVKREAELAPLAKTAGRAPHDLGRWLRGRRWEDARYGSEWENSLAEAKERARAAGGTVPKTDEERAAAERIAQIRRDLKLKKTRPAV